MAEEAGKRLAEALLVAPEGADAYAQAVVARVARRLDCPYAGEPSKTASAMCACVLEPVAEGVSVSVRDYNEDIGVCLFDALGDSCAGLLSFAALEGAREAVGAVMELVSSSSSDGVGAVLRDVSGAARRHVCAAGVDPVLTFARAVARFLFTCMEGSRHQARRLYSEKGGLRPVGEMLAWARKHDTPAAHAVRQSISRAGVLGRALGPFPSLSLVVNVLASRFLRPAAYEDVRSALQIPADRTRCARVREGMQLCWAASQTEDSRSSTAPRLLGVRKLRRVLDPPRPARRSRSAPPLLGSGECSSGPQALLDECTRMAFPGAAASPLVARAASVASSDTMFPVVDAEEPGEPEGGEASRAFARMEAAVRRSYNRNSAWVRSSRVPATGEPLTQEVEDGLALAEGFGADAPCIRAEMVRRLFEGYEENRANAAIVRAAAKHTNVALHSKPIRAGSKQWKALLLCTVVLTDWSVTRMSAQDMPRGMVALCVALQEMCPYLRREVETYVPAAHDFPVVGLEERALPEMAGAAVWIKRARAVVGRHCMAGTPEREDLVRRARVGGCASTLLRMAQLMVGHHVDLVCMRASEVEHFASEAHRVVERCRAMGRSGPASEQDSELVAELSRGSAFAPTSARAPSLEATREFAVKMVLFAVACSVSADPSSAASSPRKESRVLAVLGMMQSAVAALSGYATARMALPERQAAMCRAVPGSWEACVDAVLAAARLRPPAAFDTEAFAFSGDAQPFYPESMGEIGAPASLEGGTGNVNVDVFARIFRHARGVFGVGGLSDADRHGKKIDQIDVFRVCQVPGDAGQPPTLHPPCSPHDCDDLSALHEARFVAMASQALEGTLEYLGVDSEGWRCSTLAGGARVTPPSREALEDAQLTGVLTFFRSRRSARGSELLRAHRGFSLASAATAVCSGFYSGRRSREEAAAMLLGSMLCPATRSERGDERVRGVRMCSWVPECAYRDDAAEKRTRSFRFDARLVRLIPVVLASVSADEVAMDVVDAGGEDGDFNFVLYASLRRLRMVPVSRHRVSLDRIETEEAADRAGLRAAQTMRRFSVRRCVLAMLCCDRGVFFWDGELYALARALWAGGDDWSEHSCLSAIQSLVGDRRMQEWRSGASSSIGWALFMRDGAADFVVSLCGLLEAATDAVREAAHGVLMSMFAPITHSPPGGRGTRRETRNAAACAARMAEGARRDAAADPLWAGGAEVDVDGVCRRERRRGEVLALATLVRACEWCAVAAAGREAPPPIEDIRVRRRSRMAMKLAAVTRRGAGVADVEFASKRGEEALTVDQTFPTWCTPRSVESRSRVPISEMVASWLACSSETVRCLEYVREDNRDAALRLGARA